MISRSRSAENLEPPTISYRSRHPGRIWVEVGRLVGMTLGNEFTNLRYKINWNFHRGMRCGFKCLLILGYGFFVRLCLVMFEEFAYALFISSFRKLSSSHDFLRRRHRKVFKVVHCPSTTGNSTKLV